jgi:Na+/H+-dicarboxylate symporter
MIFGFIFSAVVGERFKKGIDTHKIVISKIIWTCLYVTVILIGGYVFDTIQPYTIQAFLPLASLYIAFALLKLARGNKSAKV